MGEQENLMSEFYNTLLELRYPAITNVEPKEIQTTILTGDSRISLLSWLLAEKSEVAANTLKVLKGSALEEQLLKYYTEMGICTKKEQLFGKCTMKQQLPTLRLLLDFMKNVHMESVDNITQNSGMSIDHILKTYIIEDRNICPSYCNIKPIMNHADALQYFEQTKKSLEDDEAKFGSVNVETKREEECNKEADEQESDTHKEKLLNEECENFIKAFSGINSWTETDTKSIENTIYSMDEDITKLHKNFYFGYG